MKIKFIKGKTALSNNIMQQVEDIINNVITIELKHLHQMKIYILDEDEMPTIKLDRFTRYEIEPDYVDNIDGIDPDYLGAFINPFSLDSEGEVEIYNTKEAYPYIEIYPNRIKNALNIKTFASFEFKTIMAKIVIHELGHAYMFSANRTDSIEDIALADEPIQVECYEDGVWFKTLEESLANWIAYNQNWDYAERELIRKFITQQPIDYKHALTLINAKKSPFELANDWRMCKKSFAPIIQYVSCDSATELENLAVKIIKNRVDQAFNFEHTGFEEILVFYNDVVKKSGFELSNLEENFEIYKSVDGNIEKYKLIKGFINLGKDQ